MFVIENTEALSDEFVFFRIPFVFAHFSFSVFISFSFSPSFSFRIGIFNDPRFILNRELTAVYYNEVNQKL